MSTTNPTASPTQTPTRPRPEPRPVEELKALAEETEHVHVRTPIR